MGNEQGKNSKMGITAMSYTTPNIESDELLALANHLRTFADSGICNRENFQDAVGKIEKFDDSDRELFIRLFVMFDTTGEQTVAFKEYLSGVGGCLLTGTAQEKLSFAFEVYDYTNSNLVSRGDMKKILNSLNLVASYFGDPVVTPKEIDDVVINVFDASSTPSEPLKYKEYITVIAEHPTTQQFVAGRGTVRFGR